MQSSGWWWLWLDKFSCSFPFLSSFLSLVCVRDYTLTFRKKLSQAFLFGLVRCSLFALLFLRFRLLCPMALFFQGVTPPSYFFDMFSFLAFIGVFTLPFHRFFLFSASLRFTWHTCSDICKIFSLFGPCAVLLSLT